MSAVSPLCVMANSSVFEVERRIAIPQLAGVFDFDRNASELLDQVFADQAACQLVPQAVSTIRSIDRNCCGVRFSPPNTAVASSRSSRPRMALEHGLRLLEDFLEHVVRIVAKLDLRGLSLQLLARRDRRAHRRDGPRESLGGDDGDFVVGQVDDLVRAAHQRRGVAGDEVLALADADHQRALQPGGDDHIRPVAEHDAEAIRAAELREGGLHGFD